MDNLRDQMWQYYLDGRPVQNEGIFRTLVYRLIAQLPSNSGNAFNGFNQDLQNWNNNHTRQNSDRLFTRLIAALRDINPVQYGAFEDWLLAPDFERQDAYSNITRIAETDLSNSENESLLPQPDSDVDSSIHSGGEEDGTNGGRRNPYALLEQKGHEGKFTAQFKARKPHLRHLKSLKEFAHYILANPTEFNKISKQRANYYKNLIAPKIGGLTPNMIKDLRAYHRQVGGKISAKDFELMLQETYKSPDKRDKNIGDYSIDESLSTPEGVVYHNPKTGETKVAYRGTEGTLKDWGNNALYAFGLHNASKRYKRSNEIQKQVEQKYGTANLDVLGHSQSGAYAQELGKNAKNVVVLNPASHPLYSPKTKNTTVVRSKGDAVSALQYLNPLKWGKKADVEIKAKTYNPVTEHMPTVLERLPEDQMLGEGRTYKQKFNKKYGFPKDKSHSLDNISKLTGYDKKHLQMILDKGKGAFYSNPQSVRPHVKSPEQWAMARLYASLDPTSKAHKVDKSHLKINKKLRNLCDCGDANCKFC